MLYILSLCCSVNECGLLSVTSYEFEEVGTPDLIRCVDALKMLGGPKPVAYFGGDKI